MALCLAEGVCVAVNHRMGYAALVALVRASAILGGAQGYGGVFPLAARSVGTLENIS